MNDARPAARLAERSKRGRVAAGWCLIGALCGAMVAGRFETAALFISDLHGQFNVTSIV